MTAPAINGRGILSARIVMPLRGVWYADVQVDAEDEDVSELLEEVELDFGSVAFEGTTRRGGVFHGRVELEVAGGGGGMEAPLEPKYYSDAPVGLILRDLAREAGETLATDIPSDLTSGLLARWTRAGGAAGDAVGELARALRRAWRVRRDGTLWMGDESWAEVELEHDLLVDEPSRNRQVLGVDGPSLEPGTLLAGRRVSHVVHRIEPAAFRTEVWFDPDADAQNPDDVVLAPLLEAYSGAWRRQDRTALYTARVVSQATDGTLEVQFDDERWPSLTKVPLRTFVPGAVIEVAAGARVLVGWEEARPDRPYGMLFESGTLSKISIVSSDIRLGGDDASSFAAKADEVLNRLNDIVAAYNGHKHSVSGSATLVPDTLVSTPLASVAADNVKVK